MRRYFKFLMFEAVYIYKDKWVNVTYNIYYECVDY